MRYLLTNQETNRLKLRLLEDSDFNIWIKLFEDPNAGRFLGMKQEDSPEQMCKQWFDKVNDRYENDLGGMNVLIDKETNEFIGQCGLLVQTVEDETRLEVGYSILPEHWGKGYASEASQKCRDFCFENNFSEDLISIVHIENKGSEKVARNNGMEIQKTLEDYKGMPVNVFRITKEDWSNLK